MIAPAGNNALEFIDGFYSVSDTQYYIKYMMKKNEILSFNPLIHVYINTINNRLVFKIKDGHKLEVKTPKSIKLFASTKKKIVKTKNGDNVP